MNWKDTVMSPTKLKQIALDSFGSRDGIRPLMPRKGEDIQEAMQDAVNHQAAITWSIAEKAGIQKVVDWVNKHGITHGVVGSKFILSPHTGFNSTGWQAKLKEWHIETD